MNKRALRLAKSYLVLINNAEPSFRQMRETKSKHGATTIMKFVPTVRWTDKHRMNLSARQGLAGNPPYINSRIFLRKRGPNSGAGSRRGHSIGP